MKEVQARSSSLKSGSRSRCQSISPVGSGLRRIAKTSQSSTVGAACRTNRKETAGVADIQTADLRNANPTTLMRGPSPCKEEDPVDVPVINEDDDLVMKTEYMTPTHVEMQRMIVSALHTRRASTLDRRIETMIKTKGS